MRVLCKIKKSFMIIVDQHFASSFSPKREEGKCAVKWGGEGELSSWKYIKLQFFIVCILRNCVLHFFCTHKARYEEWDKFYFFTLRTQLSSTDIRRLSTTRALRSTKAKTRSPSSNTECGACTLDGDFKVSNCLMLIGECTETLNLQSRVR